MGNISALDNAPRISGVLSALGVKAIAFGNHEFDQGTSVVKNQLRGASVQGPYPILKTAADGKPVAVVNTDGNDLDSVVRGGGLWWAVRPAPSAWRHSTSSPIPCSWADPSAAAMAC